MKKIITAVIAFGPLFAFAAQDVPTLSGFETLLISIGRLVNIALPIVVSIALLGFFWGLAKFVFQAGDSGARDEAKSLMIYSVVALFVMVSVWGLVRFLGSSFGIQQGGEIQFPTINNNGSSI